MSWFDAILQSTPFTNDTLQNWLYFTVIFAAIFHLHGGSDLAEKNARKSQAFGRFFIWPYRKYRLTKFPNGEILREIRCLHVVMRAIQQNKIDFTIKTHTRKVDTRSTLRPNVGQVQGGEFDILRYHLFAPPDLPSTTIKIIISCSLYCIFFQLTEI